LRPRRRQRGDIVHVEAIQGGVDFFDETIVGEMIAEGLGRGGKAARHPHTQMGEGADHLAQGGVFAAHPLHVLHGQFFKPDDV